MARYCNNCKSTEELSADRCESYHVDQTGDQKKAAMWLSMQLRNAGHPLIALALGLLGLANFLLKYLLFMCYYTCANCGHKQHFLEFTRK